MTDRTKRQSTPPRSVPPADPTQTLVTIGRIARSSVVDAVADRLRNEIVTGRLPAGSRLPSERELSLALGVNRLTLRASLARLEALGLITTRHGAGTLVASWRERAGIDMLTTLVGSTSPSDPAWRDLVASILETRRILASEAIALAAERHTADDLALIKEAEADLEAHTADPVAYARADLVFMRAVVRAARNLGLELLLNYFARWPDEQPALVHSLYDRASETVGVYPIITQLIEGGDANLARTVVRRALEEMDEAWAKRHALAQSREARESRPPRSKDEAKKPLEPTKKKATKKGDRRVVR